MTNDTHKTCHVKMNDGNPCGRKVYENEDYCICHSKNPQKDESAFLTEIRKIIDDNKIRLWDFTGFVFPEEIHIFPRTITKDVYFDRATFLAYFEFNEIHFQNNVFYKKAKFEGRVGFFQTVFNQRVNFVGAIFEKDVDFVGNRFNNADFSKVTFKDTCQFSSSIFTSESKFYKTNFQRSASFINCKFSNAYFTEAKFNKMAEFTWSAFNDYSNFFKAKFSLFATFSYCNFSKAVHFDEASFQFDVDFKDCYFEDNASFNKTEFYKKADFAGSKIMREGSFISTSFLGPVSFVRCITGEKSNIIFDNEKEVDVFKDEVDFSFIAFNKAEQVIFRNIALVKCKFSEVDLRNVQFINVKWPEKKYKFGKRKTIYDEKLLTEKLSTSGIKEISVNEFNNIAQTYRYLQINFINNYKYAEAGDFYIGEQEMIRLSKGKFGRLFSVNAFYKYISYYGENYIQPLIWLFFTILFTPLLFLFNGGIILDSKTKDIINYNLGFSFQNTFQFFAHYWKSIEINIIAIIYDKSNISLFLPESYQKFIFGLEFIFIIIILSFLLLALRRRFRRKSF